jgi:cell division septation protein DedD
MTDYSRDRLGPDDEDRLPWLEPVEEDVEESGLNPARLVMGLVIALLVLALIVGGIFWLRGRGGAGATGDGSVIKAPDSYYKERPQSPGGMDVGSGDEIVYSASKGNEVDSNIDVSGAAEAPVNVERPAVAPAAAPVAAAPAPKAPPAVVPAKPSTDAALPTKVAPPVAKPAPPKPKPVSVAPAPAVVSGGSMVQLGAFSSQAKANAAWKSLSGRFGFLSDLTQSVVPVQSGDKTLYRLRAGGGNAAGICAKLKTAGESCSVIG